MKVSCQPGGRAELVVACDRVAVAHRLVAEQLAALVEVFVCARTGFDEDVLVVVADLVAEVAEHRAVRLAKSDPQRLAIVVERLDDVDRDDAARVADDHLLAGGAAGQQIEGQPAVDLPERIDGQPDVVELVHQSTQRRRRSAPASRGPACRRRRARGGSTSRQGSGRVRTSSPAPPARANCIPASPPAYTESTAGRRSSPPRRRAPPSPSTEGEIPAGCSSLRRRPPRTRRTHGTADKRRRAWPHRVTRRAMVRGRSAQWSCWIRGAAPEARPSATTSPPRSRTGR